MLFATLDRILKMTVIRQNRAEPSSSNASYWIKSADGTENFIRYWIASAPAAYMLYLHGIEGHSLWFDQTATFLANNGICTYALDRRGSGQSQEPRGDAKTAEQLLNDAREALKFVKEKAEGKPVFLMANCWGAKIAAILAEKQTPESKMVAGLVLSSPAIEVKVDLTLAEKFSVAWRLLVGSKDTLPLPLRVEDFTNNPVYLDYIANDEKRLTRATAHFLFCTTLLTKRSQRSAKNIEMPTFIMQSGIDTIVDERGIKKWFDKLASKDKEFITYPEVHHSLDFDANPEKYMNALLAWLQKHSKELERQ